MTFIRITTSRGVLPSIVEPPVTEFQSAGVGEGELTETGGADVLGEVAAAGALLSVVPGVGDAATGAG